LIERLIQGEQVVNSGVDPSVTRHISVVIIGISEGVISASHGARRLAHAGQYEAGFHPQRFEDVIPDPSLYLELSTEEVALTLMLYLNSPGARSDVVQHGMISRHNYFNRVGNAGREYGDRQDLVDRRLMEGWAWLESNGFL